VIGYPRGLRARTKALITLPSTRKPRPSAPCGPPRRTSPGRLRAGPSLAYLRGRSAPCPSSRASWPRSPWTAAGDVQ